MIVIDITILLLFLVRVCCTCYAVRLIEDICVLLKGHYKSRSSICKTKSNSHSHLCSYGMFLLFFTPSTSNNFKDRNAINTIVAFLAYFRSSLLMPYLLLHYIKAVRFLQTTLSSWVTRDRYITFEDNSSM